MNISVEPRARSFPGAGTALLLYAIFTIALTWPLALHLGDRLPLGNNDLLQNYWNFWWWKTALFTEHQLPGHTQLIYQPGEVSLTFHTHSPANVLSTLPVNVIWNEAAALNLATLLGFLLSAWGGYFLAREILRNRGAAFVAGIILGFAPQHFEQSLEHVNLASYQCMPFFLFFFIRLLRYGGKANGFLAGLFFALNALYSWHNGLLILPCALVLFVHALVYPYRPRRFVLRDATIAGVVAVILVLPFVWPMIQGILEGETYVKPSPKKGVDPLFFLVPAENHPLWGSAVGSVYSELRNYASVGFTCYLGWVALGLAAAHCGLWIADRRKRNDALDPAGQLSFRFWAGIFVLYALLALGDRLTLAGRETGVTMPFALVQQFPLFKTVRVANRFVIPATLALSVLAAFGTRGLLQRTWRIPPRATFTAIVLLLVLDLLWIPYPLREIPQPDWIQALEKAPPGTILNIPGGHRARGAEDMYFQTLHGRPIVGGYVSVVPPSMEERVKRLPLLQLAFISEEVFSFAHDVETEIRKVLAQLPVEVVVVHLGRRTERLRELKAKHLADPQVRLYNPARGLSGKRLDEVRAALNKVWGPPQYEDSEVEIYVRPR